MAPKRKQDEVAKKSKAAITETSSHPAARGAAGRKRRNASSQPTTIEALPYETLVLTFEHSGFPDRYAAAQVCKRWLRAAFDRKFCVDVGQCGSLNEAIQKAKPGDVLDVPPNMYQESILIDKPLKLVASSAAHRAYASQRKGVVLCANHPPVVLCNAKCCFVNFLFRTNAARHESSIVSLGPDCDYVRFEKCDLAGLTGMHVPALNSSKAQLIMLGCNVFGTRSNLAAIMVMSGYLEMVGCHVHSNSIGIEVGPGAAAEIQDCDISFNDMALALDGAAVLLHNNLWGNGQVGCSAVKEGMRVAQNLQALRGQSSIPSLGGTAKRRGTPRPLCQPPAEVGRGPRTQRRVVRRSLSACRRGSAVNSIEVEGCSLRPLYSSTTSELQRRIRKQIKALVKGVYPPPDVDLDNPLEILAQSDLDSDEEDGEGSAADGEWQAGEMEEEEDEDDEEEDEEEEDAGAADGSDEESDDDDEDADDNAEVDNQDGDDDEESDDDDTSSESSDDDGAGGNVHSGESDGGEEHDEDEESDSDNDDQAGAPNFDGGATGGLQAANASLGSRGGSSDPSSVSNGGGGGNAGVVLNPAASSEITTSDSDDEDYQG